MKKMQNTIVTIASIMESAGTYEVLETDDKKLQRDMMRKMIQCGNRIKPRKSE